MFAGAPFADVPFSALSGGVLQVTVIGESINLQLGCFHVAAWGSIPDVAATWNSIATPASSWSGVTVTTTIWNEVC